MRLFGMLFVLLTVSSAVYADVVPIVDDPMLIQHDEYAGLVTFTTGLYEQYPVDRLEKTSFDRKDLVLFVEWKDLENRLYQKGLRAYDPYGALVNEWYYQFIPENGRWRTWDYFEMGACITMPGKWRFEVLMDGEVVHNTHFEIEEARSSIPDVNEVEELGVIQVD